MSTKMRSPRSGAPGPVDRLLTAYGLDRDARLCERLGAAVQTVSSWRSRGRVPRAVALQAATDTGVSADWIMRGDGEGPRRGAESAGADGAAESAPGPRPGRMRSGRMRSGGAAPEPVVPTGPPAGVADGPGLRYAVGLGDDPRLAAIVQWLGAWWGEATEEERGWMVVELRALRARSGRPF